jgi:uncharacterized metal-binding protein
MDDFDGCLLRVASVICILFVLIAMCIGMVKELIKIANA